MALNDRIFYACKAVAIVPKTGNSIATTGIPVRGLQSVGMSSTFNLEQIFEIGQLEIYENVEEVADIEVTLEKVIDGRALLFQLTSNGECATGGAGIAAAAKNQCDVYLAIYQDTDTDAAGGTLTNICWNSGMYTSSVSYNYSVDGNATESVTLVGNDRFWNDVDGGAGEADSAAVDALFTNVLDNSDIPLSGVQRRVDVDLAGSSLPAIVKSQVGDKGPLGGDSGGNYHIQSISVSADFGQENILELGRFGPYAKFTTFPIEVSSEFEVIATSGDLVSVSGANKNLGDGLTGEQITIKDNAGTVLNLGNKNKLSSVSYSGGDTGGGNATITYSFVTYNSLTVDGGNAAPEETNIGGDGISKA